MNRHIFVAILSLLLFASVTSAHGFARLRALPVVSPADGPLILNRLSDLDGNGFEASPKGRVATDAVVARDSDVRKQLFGDIDSANELLPPDLAFPVSIWIKDADTLVAEFTPADGYHLYRDKIVFRVRAPVDIQVASVILPHGEVKDDPYFGKTEVFHRPLQAVIKLDRTKNSAAGRLTLYVKLQGCNEPLGVCYAPIENMLSVTLPAGVRRD